MAGQKQKWLRATCNWFDIQMIRGRIETKHKNIEDATERKETIKQEYEDFLEDYECIVFEH
jgi:F0F1-type ATP synthase membrane subunit b/b'